MLTTTPDEIEEGFKTAKNVNSALKNFLKKEAGSHESVTRFAKDFRTAVSAGRPAAVRAFIDQKHSNHGIHFLLVSRYAHATFIDAFVEKIVSTYGDRFNATYEATEDSITVTDKKTFASIVKEVAATIDTALSEAKLPVTNFMRNSVLICIFEQKVLKEVFDVLGN